MTLNTFAALVNDKQEKNNNVAILKEYIISLIFLFDSQQKLMGRSTFFSSR